jgi:hypothetical protein
LIRKICSSLFLASTLASCSPSAAFCDHINACNTGPDDNKDSDKGSDDVAVCTATQEGLLAGLRANAESECGALANALDSLHQCEGALACKDLNADNDGGKCNPAHATVKSACDAISKNSIDCESFLIFQCSFTP